MGKPPPLAPEQQRALDQLKSVPYPPLEQTELGACAVPIATLLDLAVMKLAAISRRGIRRDFWDLYAILSSGVTLREAGHAYVTRFGVAEADLYHVLRALTYFADADRETVFPAGLSLEEWNTIKTFFRKEAPKLAEDM